MSTVGEIASLKGADVDYVTVDVTALSAVAPAAASLQMPVVATGEVTPVSYTHLDVYKRQNKGRLL